MNHCVRILIMLLVLTGILTDVGLAQDGQEIRRIDMSFGGQMSSAVADLKAAVEKLQEKMKKDPDIQNQKVRMGKFSTPGIHDSSFELQFEEAFRRLMGDLIAEESPLIASGELELVQGKLQENHGMRVVQITLTIERKFRKLASVTEESSAAGKRLKSLAPTKESTPGEDDENFTTVTVDAFKREVNRSEDIARIAGATFAPTDTKNPVKRNQEVINALAEPRFDVFDKHFIAAKGHSERRVAIFKQTDGEGKLVPVVPEKKNGMAFVDLSVNDTFSIVLVNEDTACDTSAEVSIDGLDVANTFCVDGAKYNGYLLSRKKGSKAGRTEVPGWLKTAKSRKNNVFKFVINKLGEGAATEMQSRNSEGVIHVAFFESVPMDEALPARSAGEAGKGELMDIDYEVKKMQTRESPISQISIRYRNVFATETESN